MAEPATRAGGTTHRAGSTAGTLLDGPNWSGHRGPPARPVLTDPIAEPVGGVIAPLRRFRSGQVEVQVAQQAGGVRGHHVQPVLRGFPEAAWRVRRRLLPGLPDGLDPPGEALDRPGGRAQPAG
ncbi:hypothetical protein [Micromonospora taraxaci]|uniref:hypothetical protein n=1 Tax=Micromonospora taraxaci TaxID=1316803 RepID=UPI003C30B1F6